MENMFRVDEKYIHLGEDVFIDQTAIIGYRPGRNLEEIDLYIGDNAMIRSNTVIYAGCKIGVGLQTGHNVVIREQNQIGDNLQVWNNTVIDYGCVLGNNIKLHCNIYIAQFTTMEDNVFMAPGVTVANDMHPGCQFSNECMRGPYIEKGVKIGVNVTLLPFIRIGRRSLIGAGSVVTRDIPAESVVYGNPAKVRGSIYDLKCVSGITDKPFYRI